MLFEGWFAGYFRLLIMRWPTRYYWQSLYRTAVPAQKTVSSIGTQAFSKLVISPDSVGSRQGFVFSEGKTGAVGQESLSLVLVLTESCREHHFGMFGRD